MIPLKTIIHKLKHALLPSRKQSTERKVITFSQAESIGILIHLTDPGIKISVEEFVKKIQTEGKSVQALCFSEKPTFFRFNFPCTYFSLKDLDWKGDFNGDLINKFTKTPFDYLYSINNLPILPFNYILQKSKARCRVGKYEENANLDLMIRIENGKGLDYLMDQMIKYSKKISTND